MNIPVLLARKRRARALAAGTVALAAGAIVLLRAPGSTIASTVHTVSSHGPSPRIEFSGPHVHGRVALSQGAIAVHGARHVYAEVRLTADRDENAASARPVAMAVVLDTSGSMAGEKIQQARRAVLELIERMRDDDRITFVTYSDGRNLLQSLARVGDVRDRLRVTIPTIEASGGTMIPAALELGASSLAIAPETFARRIVLISDGQDGSGRPLDQVASEVRGRADMGVTVSTLGVGADYDESFMTRLADAGRGNYEFMRDGSQLASFLARELREAGSTSVEQAVTGLTLPQGWHLTHAFGAEATAEGSRVTLPIGALFAGDQRTVVLDLAVDADAEGSAGEMVADVNYRIGPEARPVAIHVGSLPLRVVASEEQAVGTRDMTVYAAAESVVMAERQREAVEAWRRGDVARAAAMAQSNAAALDRLQHAAPSPALMEQSNEYARDAVTFGSVSAASENGRSYGLRSNVSNRARQVRAIAY
jgi:Ca-activated chloride channel family protein